MNNRMRITKDIFHCTSSLCGQKLI